MVNPIHTVQNKIHLAIYGYNPQEFMPVWYGDELMNRNKFIAYKLKRVARSIGRNFVQFIRAFVAAIQTSQTA